ncbi:hypothetical protein ACLB2K_005343 [Fragaria x ananassa]
MARPRFVIEASEAESMAKQSNLTVVQLLPSLVKSAQSLARVPISKFHVGAVGYGSSGRIFFGVNLEFPGLPLHYSVHAEQFLVTNLSIQSEPRLDYVAVSAAPCGHCRQFFQKIRRAQDINILITSDESGDDGNHNPCGQFSPLRHLLPHRFGPEDLLGEDVPLVLEKHNNALSFIKKPETFGDDLISHALEAANRAALVDFIVSGGGGYEKIVAAVLVEKEDALVKQEQAARLLLQTISPKVEFRVLHCK